MESTCALRGHARSLSSLATITPLPLHQRQWSASSPPRLATGPSIKLPDEYTIPLPPSAPISEYGEEIGDKSQQETETQTAVPAETQPFDPMEVDQGISRKSREHEEPTTAKDDTMLEGERDLSSGPPIVETHTADSLELPVSLLDLLDLIEKDAFEREQSCLLQNLVTKLLRQCGNHSRGLPVRKYLYRRMVEGFRADRKDAFGSLYLQSSSLKIPTEASLGAVSSTGVGERGHIIQAKPEQASWFTTFSLNSKQSLTTFLNSSRNDTSFLADRLVTLSSSQLTALVRPHRQALSSEPALDASPGLSRFDPRNIRQRLTRSSEPNSNQIPMVHDPLLLLVHGLFDSLAPLGSPEKNRQLNVWSSVCASIVQDGKFGSDDFCLVVLDIFADSSQWTIKSQLELYLQDLVQSGQFLVDPHASQDPSVSLPVEVQNARLAVKTSEFFDNALVRLISLISDAPSLSGIPRAALDLVHATLAKIQEPSRRLRARNFFVSRWFCTSFLSTALLFPERHQMLLRSHVSAAVRQKIFKELAIRLQKAIFRVLSPHNSLSNLASVEAEAGTQRLLDLFNPLPNIHGQDNNRKLASKNDRPYIMLFAKDGLTLANTLYPENFPDTVGNNSYQRPGSMASSYTGSTTLTAGTNGPRTGTSSSAAPSISGTSMTSNTLSSDMFFSSFDKQSGNVRTIEYPYKSRPGTSSGFFSGASSGMVSGFLPELNECVNKQDATRNANQDKPMLFYINNDDGSVHADLDGTDSRTKEVEVAPLLDIPVFQINPPEYGILEQAFSRATSGRNSLDHTCDFLSSLQTSSIESLFQFLLIKCRACQDFRSEYFWSKSLKVSSSISEEAKVKIVLKAVQRCQESIRMHQVRSKTYQEWLLSLQDVQHQQADIDRRLTLQTDALRDKMWFVSDVRHSSRYEDARNVIRALATMAGPAPTKQTGMAAWARQRLRGSFGHERAQTQVFEALSAPKEQGGPNKLSDSQVDLISSWLNQESIENFCKGEERIHRFCFEIQKCVRKLVSDSIVETPVLWSSHLYQTERETFYTANESAVHQVQQQHLTWTTGYTFPDSASYSSGHKRPHTGNTGLGVSIPAQNFHSLPSMQARESREMSQDPGIYPPQPSPGVPARLPRDWTLPPSPISPALNKDTNEALRVSREKFVERLRRTLFTLLISDLGSSLWNNGSETDSWLNEGQVPTAFSYAFDEFSHTLEDRTRSQTLTGNIPDQPGTDQGHAIHKASSDFSFQDSFKVLLQRFRLSSDPFLKLECLVELTELAQLGADSDESTINFDALSPMTDTTMTRATSGFGRGHPRTRLTRLEEVTANCEERRLISQGALPTMNGTYNPSTLFSSANITEPSRATAIVRALIVDERYRPSTLFRDLQMIAAFVPSSVLDQTPRGTAFWDVGLAAMNLKSETCKLTTIRATEILGFHLNTGNARGEPTRRDSGENSGQTNNKPTLSVDALSKTNLEDAAKLYTISAMEGDPTAARELGLFYLTHPELVRRVTLPLSKPGEVFRHTFALGNGDRARAHDGGLDPPTFAVAFHWMEFAANAGDADARTFLRENTDLGKGF